jgi:hypothetical protein
VIRPVLLQSWKKSESPSLKKIFDMLSPCALSSGMRSRARYSYGPVVVPVVSTAFSGKQVAYPEKLIL